MLKYIKGHMESIAGIEIYPIVSLLIFFLFFVAVGLWAWKADKGYIQKMSQLPLEAEEGQGEL